METGLGISATNLDVAIYVFAKLIKKFYAYVRTYVAIHY